MSAPSGGGVGVLAATGSGSGGGHGGGTSSGGSVPFAASSHAYTSIRSPILRGQLSLQVNGGRSSVSVPATPTGGGMPPGAAWSVAPGSPLTLASGGSGSAMSGVGASHRAGGGGGGSGTGGTTPAPLLLPAQPTQPPALGGTHRLSSSPPRPSPSPPQYISPSLAQAAADKEREANRRRSGGVSGAPRSSPSASPPGSAAAAASAGSSAGTPVTAATAGAPTTDDWQLDSSATACPNCAIKFSILTRKHHCRSCGQIHCDNCSKFRIAVPSKNYTERVRVCGKCYASLKKGGSSRRSGSGANAHAQSHGRHGHATESPRNKGSRSHAASHSSSSAVAAAAAALASPSPLPSASPPPSMSLSMQADPPGDGGVGGATASELQSQLSALHQLHSSYQPEHHALTSLLSNAAQMDQVYSETIRVLHGIALGQAEEHHRALRAQEQILEAQRRHIEALEDVLRVHNIAPIPPPLPLPLPSSTAASPAPTPAPSTGAGAGGWMLNRPTLPRARSTGESGSGSFYGGGGGGGGGGGSSMMHRASSPQLRPTPHGHSLHAPGASASTGSNPSSRASPAFHASASILRTPSSSSSSAASSSSGGAFPLPALPFAGGGYPHQHQQHPHPYHPQAVPSHVYAQHAVAGGGGGGGVFDAASEEAYLEMEGFEGEEPLPQPHTQGQMHQSWTQGHGQAAFANHADGGGSALSQSAVYPSRHAHWLQQQQPHSQSQQQPHSHHSSHRPQWQSPPLSASVSASFAPLSVTEPPSPPPHHGHGHARHSTPASAGSAGSAGGSGRNSPPPRRATSHPTGTSSANSTAGADAAAPRHSSSRGSQE